MTCRYCDGYSWENDTLVSACSAYEVASAAVDGKEGVIRLFVSGDDEGDDCKPINYCPMCGRKLGSE